MFPGSLGLTKEYTLNHIMDLYIILAIFLNEAILGSWAPASEEVCFLDDMKRLPSFSSVHATTRLTKSLQGFVGFMDACF